MTSTTTTETAARIYDIGGADWAGLPETSSHDDLVEHAMTTIVETAADSYGSPGSVEVTRDGAQAAVVVESHGRRTMLRIIAGE